MDVPESKRGYLSSFFVGTASKRLSAVEAHPERSNQHELNGVNQLREIFGPQRRKLPATFIYLGSDDDEALSESGFVTWYDARENHPSRTEYRLYFPTTPVYERAAEGDLAIIALRPDGSVLIVVTRNGSTYEAQLRWLFNIGDDLFRDVTFRELAGSGDVEIGFAARQILAALGIEPEPEREDYLEILQKKFGGRFPTTKVFSRFARESLIGVSAEQNADATLVAWLEHEEMLFRTLERHLMAERLERGFPDVDDFIAFSLSVQNRRKSRAGAALENHLEHLFHERRLKFTRGGETENKSKPDFIFPGISEYHDPQFPSGRLVMLAAKSTCKDRWRQALAEAHRIWTKHLLTLEPGISTNQTAEMEASSLRLVVPSAVLPTYTPQQRKWLLNVEAFIALAQEQQAR